MERHSSTLSAPVLLGLGCFVLPALAARDPFEQDKLSIEAFPGARFAVRATPSPELPAAPKRSLAVATDGGASTTATSNLGGITKDPSSIAQSLGAALTALTNPEISAQPTDAQESLVEETADVHRAVAQLLGIVDGDLCPHVAEGQKHGCHLGCRCGILQRCFSKPYVGLGTGFNTSNSSTNEAQGKVDVGICRMSDPALMAVLAAVSITVFICVLLLRRLRTDASVALDDRPSVTRAALESRLRSATALSAKQRQAILDEFCGNEKPGLNRSLKESNFISVGALPKECFDGDCRIERVAGTGGTVGSDDSDTSDTDCAYDTTDGTE